MHCPHAARCPGCPLLDAPYPEQLETKREALATALARYPSLGAVAVTETAAAEPVTHFRVRAKLVVQDAALGLFARGTHEVVDIPECQVLRPRVQAVASALRRSLPLGALSSVDLRETDAGVLVTLALPPHVERHARRALAERVAALDPNVAGVAATTRADDAPQLLGGGLEVLVGPSELPHRPDLHAPFHYAAHGAFTQAHAGQLARLHAAVEAELATLRPGASATRPLAGMRVLELYAGSGALALRLAARGASVTLVESFAPAVRLAERAAAEQELALTTRAADAGAALEELGRTGARYDAVLVDPPRRGLAPEVRSAIARLAPSLLLYISCAPDTFARDAADFGTLGLRLEAATPFDMIPQSDAVEALGRLRPAPAPAPVVLAEGERFVALDKPPLEPVADAPSRPSSLVARARRLRGAERAVPLGALEPGASGACVLARRPEDAAALEAALRAGKSEWLALVRGVMRSRGHLPAKHGGERVRYRRLEVCAGHSLLALEGDAGSAPVRRALHALGHPVLGDARHGDRRANLHFLHRHQLERAFLHRRAQVLALPDGELRVEAPLAPDLERVLASLRDRDGRV